MKTMNGSWTDARLDDLATGMREGFKRVDKDIRGLRGETNAGFERVDGEFKALRGEMNRRFDSLQRTMIWLFGSFSVSLVGLVAALVLTAP